MTVYHCKVEEVRLNAGPGDAAYTVSARFRVIGTEAPPPILFVGAADPQGTVWASRDKGETFVRVWDTGGSALSVLATVDRSVIAGEWGGGGAWWRSTDQGRNFHEVGNAKQSRIHEMIQLENGNIVAGIGTDAEVWLSRDDGVTWFYVGEPTAGTSVYAFCVNALGEVLAGITYSARIWRSRDNGENWALLHSFVGMDFVQDLLTTSTGTILAFISDGFPRVNAIWRSIDHGVNWVLAHTFPDAGGTSGALAVLSDGSLLAGTYGTYMYRSVDDGQTWNLLSRILELTIYVQNLFVASWGDVFATLSSNGTEGGIWRSQDNGASWSPMNVPMTDNSIYRMTEMAGT